MWKIKWGYNGRHLCNLITGKTGRSKWSNGNKRTIEYSIDIATIKIGIKNTCQEVTCRFGYA